MPSGPPDPLRPPPTQPSTDVPSSMDAKEEPAAVTDDAAPASPACSKDDPLPPNAADASDQATEKSTGGNQSTSQAVPSSIDTTKPTLPSDTSSHARKASASASISSPIRAKHHSPTPSNAKKVSEWSHQQLAPSSAKQEVVEEQEDEWQEMPAYAPYDIYDDDGKLLARENEEVERVSGSAPPGYAELGGPARGYTRVQVDEDAQSATSMDDNTAYLFKEPGTDVHEDEEARDALAQMQATKDLLSENQRIAYVGVVRLAMSLMAEELGTIERSRKSKGLLDIAIESLQLWSQKMMVRLYGHMELVSAEQIMIEQLAEHGLRAGDLTPSLMQTSRVRNPMVEPSTSAESDVASSAKDEAEDTKVIEDRKDAKVPETLTSESTNGESTDEIPPPPYDASIEDRGSAPGEVQLPSQLPKTANIDIDLRWTILCDLFLILISDSTYDARSRVLLEKVGSYLAVSSLDICRFEKRVTEALEMEEEAQKEDWNEADHMADRKKRARRRRLALMGLATVGGGLVIGLSAGLLAPVIGAGLAAGFTTIGVTGTSGFLAGAGGAAVIGTGGLLTGGTIGVRAANRRTGAVKTFEYRPLHNNKRVNLIVTVAGWMSGKVDDVRLPFSTVDPVMGDMYSILWEPEMLRSMGDTINILATEALTQGLQQILGSTVLIALMAALQLPIVLSKLSYLIDNPWSNSLARADMAGLILADSLIDRNLGARPITLVGFSLGSRVIYNCLRELARKGAMGIVQNVYVFGTPIVTRKDEYLRARTVVSGKFVNGYAKNDWILAYLFRATSGGIGRVAGLAEVDVPGIENVDVTEHVPGHMSYRQAMPKILRQAGWIVTSDEFTEIEDPDPENHERRQRELINEIEEARKELEEKGQKKRFGFFSKPKKMKQKKDWETYDERLKGGVGEDEKAEDEKANGEPGSDTGALYDIDAIRREAAELAAEGIQIKELKSTMPPMRLDSGMMAAQSSSSNAARLPFRTTQSHEDLPVSTEDTSTATASTMSLDQYHAGHDAAANGEEQEISMSFEPLHSHPLRANASMPRSPSPGHSPSLQGETGREIKETNGPSFFDASSEPWAPPKNLSNGKKASSSPQRSPSLTPHSQPSPSPVAATSVSAHSSNKVNGHEAYPSEKPGNPWGEPLSSPAPNVNLDRNVWADEDENFGQEKEVSMTFE